MKSPSPLKRKSSPSPLSRKKGWSEEKALKEAEAAFGKPVDEWNDEPALVCDDCYQEILPANHPELVDKALGEI